MCKVSREWLMQQTETNPNLASVTAKLLNISVKEFFNRVNQGQIEFDQLPLKFVTLGEINMPD